jgi:hypothetical protein
LINGSIVQNNSTVTIARAAIDYIDKIKNTEINDGALTKLKMLTANLIDVCNLRLLTSFPIAIEVRPINEIEFEIKSCYFPGLEFSKTPNLVIYSFQQAENLSNEARCLDALRIFVTYCNIVVFSRFDRGLELRERRLDDIPIKARYE